MINQQNLGGLDSTGQPQDPGRDGYDSGLPVDKFGEVIGYDDSAHIGYAQHSLRQYNGNISWLMYSMYGVNFSGTPLVGYSFSYDKANRLTSGDFGYYSGSWHTTSAYDINSLDYYDDGEIENIARYKQDGTDNYLVYTYQTGKNRLSSIYDPSTGHTYYFTYDANGNVTGDTHRGIAFIIYNINNLPGYVYKTDSTEQHYAYDPEGSRVQKWVKNNGSYTYTYYFNGQEGNTYAVCLGPNSANLTFNILGAGLDSIGQVKVESNSVTGRYYYLKDHLGNIKVTVDGSGNVVGYDDYYPFGEIMPGRSEVPSGADARYKFTGKEKDSETGLYYFGRRNYDSWFGGWDEVDPMEKKYPGLSPYLYCEDNPIDRTDPNGMQDGGPNDQENIWQKMAELFNLLNFQNNNTYENQNDQGEVRNVPAVKALAEGEKIVNKSLKRIDSKLDQHAYVALMVGKQSTFSADVNAHAGLTFTSRAIYFSSGFDAVASPPNLTSISLATGVTESPNQTGKSFMITGGLFGVGVETGPTISSNRTSWSGGLVFSNSYFWLGVTETNNLPIYNFNK
jgi:RHS repeat-associated protein